MFTMKYGTNIERKQDPAVNVNTSIREFLASHGMDCSRGQLTLDGTQVGGTEVNKTFAQCGINAGETHSLYVTVKADGAAA